MRNLVGPAPFAWAEGLQYSQAVRLGDVVFTAGIGGFDDAGGVVAGGIEPQLRQAFANVERALATHGASLRTAAKLTVYLTSREDYETFRRVRADVLTPPYPASTAVRADLLLEGMLVEIDCVAAVGAEREQG